VIQSGTCTGSCVCVIACSPQPDREQATSQNTQCEITKITIERYASPFGIQRASPRLPWKFGGAAVDWRQASYDRFQSRTVPCGERRVPLFVPWLSRPLKSLERATLRVRATSVAGDSIRWETVDLEAALLQAEDWSPTLSIGEEQDPGPAKRTSQG
jgi:alpha-L-rhamnosidase